MTVSILSESTLDHHTASVTDAYAQPSVETVKHRNLTIDLDNGLKTNAELTVPAVGEGPFPGVLLIHGSGANDMNETGGLILVDNKTGSKIYPDKQTLFQLNICLREDLSYLDMIREALVPISLYQMTMYGEMSHSTI